MGVNVKELLEKQMIMLSEQSKNAKNVADLCHLCQLTHAMVSLLNAPWPRSL